MAEVETPTEMFRQQSQGDVSPTSSSNNGASDVVDSQADPRKLFVGGIPYDAVAQDLLNYFERYGPIREAVVIRDKNNPLQNQGYGFVIFEDPRIAQWVLSTEKNPIIKGRKANVQKGHKRAGLPSMSNGFHLPATDSASLLPSIYYTEPLNMVDAREAAAASGLLSLNQVSWPLTNANERLLAAAGAFGNGYQYGAPTLASVPDQPLQWTQSLLMQQQQQQQQQQQNQVYLPQAGVILPTPLSHASSSYAAAAAAAAAAGISPSSSWPTNGLVHPNGAFNLLGATTYMPTATSANALNAFAAAVAGQQHVNGLMTSPAAAALYTSATANGSTGSNPHSLWRETSPSEAQAPLVTYVASPSNTPPAAMTSLHHVIEQSNGVA